MEHGNNGNYYNNRYGNGTQDSNEKYKQKQNKHYNQQGNYRESRGENDRNQYYGNRDRNQYYGNSQNREENNQQNNYMAREPDSRNTGKKRNYYEINRYAVRTCNGCSVTGYVFPNNFNGPIAYCSICINNLIVINDVRLMPRGDNGKWFIAMPSRQMKGGWKDIAFIMNSDMLNDIENAICEKYVQLTSGRN